MKEFNCFRTDLDIKSAVKEYAEKIENLDDGTFDIIVLGVGVDGHIASLFPNREYLKNEYLNTNALETEAPDSMDVKKRLTISLKSIIESKRVVIILNGEEKKEVVHELLNGKKTIYEFPAKMLLSHPDIHILEYFNPGQEATN